jgi:hypothetical protein
MPLQLNTIEEYNFVHGLHRNYVNGKYIAIQPHDLGRPLTHAEMDYNLILNEQTQAGFRIFGSNADLTLSDDDIGKSLVFHKITADDDDFTKYQSKGYSVDQYIWILSCCDHFHCEFFVTDHHDGITSTDSEWCQFVVDTISSEDSGVCAFIVDSITSTPEDPCVTFVVDTIVAQDSLIHAGTPTPTPSSSEVAPTPTPSSSEVAPTPTPSSSEAAPTPTPSSSEVAPTPTPSSSEAGPGIVNFTVEWKIEDNSLNALQVADGGQRYSPKFTEEHTYNHGNQNYMAMYTGIIPLPGYEFTGAANEISFTLNGTPIVSGGSDLSNNVATFVAQWETSAADANQGAGRYALTLSITGQTQSGADGPIGEGQEFNIEATSLLTAPTPTPTVSTTNTPTPTPSASAGPLTNTPSNNDRYTMSVIPAAVEESEAGNPPQYMQFAIQAINSYDPAPGTTVGYTITGDWSQGDIQVLGIELSDPNNISSPVPSAQPNAVLNPYTNVFKIGTEQGTGYKTAAIRVYAAEDAIVENVEAVRVTLDEYDSTGNMTSGVGVWNTGHISDEL